MSLLDDDIFLRYQRQIALPDIGETGQCELSNKHVLIVGCGGLGTTVSLFLVGAGIGSIVLVDHDAVEISNLHRQIAYRESDIGTQKVHALANQLRALNHNCRVRTIDKNTIGEAKKSDDKKGDTQLQLEIMLADVVVDCSDNFPTRHQINRICYQQKTVLVTASAIGWNGQLSVHRFLRDSPCYRCLVGETAELSARRCQDAGVLGPVVGTMASLQALQVIQELLRNIDPNSSLTTHTTHPCARMPSSNSRPLQANDQVTPNGSMAEFFHFDGRRMQLKSLRYEKDLHCPVCRHSVDAQDNSSRQKDG
ncbi:HesA/MoeB/ThiF family protein [Vibrio rhizosphaerae]|uniref:HesA/MoeB/ThiF family protein n=1 Tax=Vibrio rhizosphaerae TaxID=398736 RepID=A0ABU4IPP3_9VIBR|nr:HesA/MoeB/ThiF family protein [Vibrio rhizosphaerae]MDW6091374.1 HesA/MoeB/ThiF family protein [Vibrio rhizosphaerae]